MRQARISQVELKRQRDTLELTLYVILLILMFFRILFI